MKTILVDGYHVFVVKNEGVYKPLHDLLETYPNPKIILTNANTQEMEERDMVDLPYEIFTLNRDPAKADPGYYERMLEHFKLSKDDVVYFEHNAEAVESAKSVGITTHHYDKKKRDLEALKTFLDSTLA